MNNINTIVNLEDHPIENKEYRNYCFENLRKKSVLTLENFLNQECLYSIQQEALLLEGKAFYCSQKHTVLLNQYNESIDREDPLNIEVISDKGCVPHDLIEPNSQLNLLYHSSNFKSFLISVLDIKNIFPYTDTLSSINYNYYQNKQQLGWHFDNASFAITLMIQSPDKGGVFEYINKGRDYNSNFIDKDFIYSVLNDEVKVKQLVVNPGTLVLFYGRNYLHRVTPVESIKSRILVTLNYNEEDNIKLSENARKTFFGRIV